MQGFLLYILSYVKTRNNRIINENLMCLYYTFQLNFSLF
jgi:hypothetical protein